MGELDLQQFSKLDEVRRGSNAWLKVREMLANQEMPPKKETPVVTSAGALVEGLKTLKARKIAMVAPYMKPLTKLVAEYINVKLGPSARASRKYPTFENT